MSRSVTADELLAMPDDGVLCELVNGKLRSTPLLGEEHGVIAAEILIRLGSHVVAHGLGTVYARAGFHISAAPDTVLAPDAAFVSRERIEQVAISRGYRSGVPDLAVEVVSPGDSFVEVEAKVARWLSAGCRMVIVVNPARRAATVYRSRDDITLLTEGDVLDAGTWCQDGRCRCVRCSPEPRRNGQRPRPEEAHPPATLISSESKRPAA